MNPEGAALSKLIGAIATLGPRNIPNIASELSIPVETARHRLKRQILGRGIRIHAGIDFGKLGLQRSWAFLELTNEYSGREEKVARALSEVGYLTYFARTSPEERFLAQFAVPRSKLQEHERFLSGLVGNGILRSYVVHNLAWTRHLSMKPEYYNFKQRVWEIDWEALDRLRQIPIAPTTSQAVQFDKKDLLILKEMQIDSSIQFVDMATKLKIDVKTLLYHYHLHVKQSRFVTNYLARWTGDPKNLRRYAVLHAKVFMENISRNEILSVQDVFTRLPFLWSDAYSADGFYLADLVIPLILYPDTLSFLQRNLGDTRKKFQIVVVDNRCTSAFTLPHHMFDEEIGWMFETQTALERFRIITTAESLEESAKNKGGL
ncbi:MAG: hypothetical protein HYU02_05965 [Thaumarchaeota archaeon]|nr:hypothetical protein [Nitrososphaerota archaeon]